LKAVQDRYIAYVKIEQEVIGALLNGDIATSNPQTTPNSTFCIDFHIFIVGEQRDLRFGAQVDHSKSQPMDDKLSLKRAWSHDMSHFKFLVPLKFIWNGLSYRLQILYTAWTRDVFVIGLTSNPLSGHGHGHVTSLNFALPFISL